jgi:Family of unknown function (DUF6459)
MSTPSLRRLPLPRSEPPFDDELADAASQWGPVQVSAVQGTLALAFGHPSGRPAAPDGRSPLRLLPSPPDGPQKPPDSLPEPRWWASRLAQALVEVMAGDRPPAQLSGWTDEDVYADLRQRVRMLGRLSAARRGAPTRALVRSVRVSEPADGVAEACALVQHGPRSRALAFRLEGEDGRWRCTALEVG